MNIIHLVQKDINFIRYLFFLNFYCVRNNKTYKKARLSKNIQLYKDFKGVKHTYLEEIK